MTNQGKIANKLEMRNAFLKTINDKIAKTISKRDELKNSINDDSTEDEVAQVTKSIEDLDEELEVDEKNKTDVEEEIKELEGQLNDVQKDIVKDNKGEKRNMGNKPMSIEQRDAINHYIRNKEMRAAEGIKSTDAALLIPEEIIYVASDEIDDIPSLRHLVDVQFVTKEKGSKPIRKHATQRLNSVAELEKNPELAKPVFLPIDWSVDTYRGAIPISQEAIDDSEQDLTALVAKDAKEQKINTENYLIINCFKSFAQKTITSVDDIKQIVNVDLKSAYKKRLVVSSSAYQVLDTLKDKEGRYLMQPDITKKSGYTFGGMEIEKYDDDMFGAVGVKVGFIGDTKQAVLLSDRKQLEVKWTDHDIYGEYLRAGARMGVDKKDPESGFYVTFDFPVVTEDEGA